MITDATYIGKYCILLHIVKGMNYCTLVMSEKGMFKSTVKVMGVTVWASITEAGKRDQYQCLLLLHPAERRASTATSP
jgi:hypothetical protein